MEQRTAKKIASSLVWRALSSIAVTDVKWVGAVQTPTKSSALNSNNTKMPVITIRVSIMTLSTLVVFVNLGFVALVQNFFIPCRD